MGEPLRILLVEDREEDALLIERALRRISHEFQAKRVFTRETFMAALQEYHPDLILSDNTMPTFSGREALRIAAEILPGVPFVYVSGTIGEENAIEALRQGATDYVFKDNLIRLVPVVDRALREASDRRERAQLFREYMQAQKMESLGKMAGAIAHDFNNLLTVINGRAELLAGLANDPQAVLKSAESIANAGKKGKELTTRLLAFSRGDVLEGSLFDLNDRLREFGPMFSSVLGTAIPLTLHRCESPLPLHGNFGQIDQVLMNLLVNARDAMPNGGSMVITTTRLDSPDGPPPGFPLVAAGSYALLEVADTGVGMSSDVKARIFEPFYTTKAPGQGTGLGLATVYGIVKDFGGSIQLDSELGHGTTFRLLFRLAPAGAAGASGSSRRPVLLVDDEPEVRGYARHVLQAAGSLVIEAGGGAEALGLLQQDPQGYDMLVTDVMMPGIDGVQVARKARELHPGIPVVFLSGAAAALQQAAGEIADARTLAKPYTPTQLIKLIQAYRES